MRWLMNAVVLLPLLVGGNTRCPAPEYPDLESCPFPAAPNLIQGVLLGWVRLEVGQKLTHTRTWCDEEGDPADAELVSAPDGVRLINKSKVSRYTLLWTPTQPMTAAIVVRVTDKPLDRPSKSNVGTILVQVVPRGTHFAPKGCGSPPQ